MFTHDPNPRVCMKYFAFTLELSDAGASHLG